MSFVEPTEDEKAMVAKLKLQLQDEAPHIQHRYSDTSVLRFYRGRDRDESKAFKALIKHVEWREVGSQHTHLLAVDSFFCVVHIIVLSLLLLPPLHSFCLKL